MPRIKTNDKDVKKTKKLFSFLKKLDNIFLSVLWMDILRGPLI